MQLNKVHSITVISAVALELGVEEELLHEISIGMEPEDGILWVTVWTKMASKRSPPKASAS